MSESKSRRTFLGKMAMGVTALTALPVLGISHRESNSKNKKLNAVKNIKPLGFQWETSDPFLFCVHHEDNYPEGNEDLGPNASLEGRHIGQDFILKDGWRMYHGTKVPGFPGHPHRGFETITVVRKGLIDHSDSMGASGRYGNGDVQWMTAGKGVQHAEMFPCLNQDKANPLELFQIWLNLPKSNKMVEPHFKMLWSETIPIINTEDNKTMIEVLVGELDGYKSQDAPPGSWANDPNNYVGIYNIHMQPNASYILPSTKEGVNRTIYFYEGGDLKINGEDLPYYHSAEVEADEQIELQNGNSEVKILVLQGRPINEPVVQHGPFVMNTKEEINQAFQDYHATKFGGWPWPNYDQVHDRKLGRFAKHADGKEEYREA